MDGRERSKEWEEGCPGRQWSVLGPRRGCGESVSLVSGSGDVGDRMFEETCSKRFYCSRGIVVMALRDEKARGQEHSVGSGQVSREVLERIDSKLRPS